jgi:prepilin-type N-terminal cleavage/methylation domain-containing protein
MESTVKLCARGRSAGFSFLELLIVMAILVVISGAVFQVINMTTERSSSEQTKLDMFQGAREFMDQMTRDLRQAGYPNARNFAPGILSSPLSDDLRVAVGLVRIAPGELWFEADVDGSGVVSVIHYFLDTSTTNNCPCLKRSQLPKIAGNPYTGQTTPSYQVEVQGVKNTDIFSAYNSAAVQTLPLDFNGNADTISALDTIKATISLEGTTIDLKTHKKPVATLVTTVRLNNCSLAASGQQTSCF